MVILLQNMKKFHETYCCVKNLNILKSKVLLNYLEEFPEVVELSVDVAAHCHWRVHPLHVALLNWKLHCKKKRKSCSTMFNSIHTQNLPRFCTEDLDITFFDHFTLSQLFNLLIQVTCVPHPGQQTISLK